MRFSCDDAVKWRHELTAYDERLGELNLDFKAINGSYQGVHDSVCKRTPPYLTKDELRTVGVWMLNRGRRSADLLGSIESLGEEKVNSASKDAFEFLSQADVSQAVSCLMQLDGIDAVSASAVLAAYKPDIAPYMSSEACRAVMGGNLYRNKEKYLEYADMLKKKAEKLNEGGENFTASDLERVLWMSMKWSKKVEASSSGKRKGEQAESSNKRNKEF